MNCTVLQELQNKTWMSRYLINNHVRWCCQVETLCQLHLSEITKLAESFHLYQWVLLQVTLQLYFSMIIQKLWAKDSMAIDRDSGLMVMYLFWRPQLHFEGDNMTWVSLKVSVAWGMPKMPWNAVTVCDHGPLNFECFRKSCASRWQIAFQRTFEVKIHQQIIVSFFLFLKCDNFGQTVFNLYVGIRRIKNSSGLIVLKNI